MGHSDDARPRVHVLSAPDTADALSDIVAGLDRLGVDAAAPATLGQGELRAVVVILSAGALSDSSWTLRLEPLRTERLVPVAVGEFAENEVPQFLRELNWAIYQPHDHGFLARLYAGINTDASRYRDARDTRALAERWQASGRSADFLIDDIREVNRRIASAGSAEGGDPLVPDDEVVWLTGSFRDRIGFVLGGVPEADAVPTWMTRTIAVWLTVFRGTLDKMVTAEATTPIAFLTASRRHAAILRRQGIRRAIFRVALAGVAAAAMVFSFVTFRQAILKNTNAVSFAYGDVARTNRPDLAAIKAGGSLVDSGTYTSDDGRLRIAVDALSQHWPLGYLPSGTSAFYATRFLDDGSILGIDWGGTIWNWDSELNPRTETVNGLAGMQRGDISGSGDMLVTSDGANLTLVRRGTMVGKIGQFDHVSQLRLARSEDRLMIQSENAVYVLSGLDGRPSSPTKLGDYDAILDMAQTVDGHVAALAKRDGSLEVVHDDGTVRKVGAAPTTINNGALAADGESFALDVDGTIWTSTGGPARSSGIVIPGVDLAMDMTADGLVLVSDRTRGSWLADPSLGISLGTFCDALPGTTSFALDRLDNRVLCTQGSGVTVDSLAELRPAISKAAHTPAPKRELSSDGQVAALSVGDGLIRLERHDGTSVVFDATGVSLVEGYTQPAWAGHVDSLEAGALIEATSEPNTLAVTPDGNTFAVGFIDGRLIEVDVDRNGRIATVGSWQLPDHSAVSDISWSSEDHTILATTVAGTTWHRLSCAGCWRDHTLTSHIADRTWLCYEDGDIADLGDTARDVFGLRGCNSLRGGKR